MMTPNDKMDRIIELLEKLGKKVGMPGAEYSEVLEDVFEEKNSANEESLKHEEEKTVYEEKMAIEEDVLIANRHESEKLNEELNENEYEKNKKRKPNCVFRRSLKVVFGATFLFLTFFLAVNIFFPSFAYNVFGIRPFIISYTGSMEPELNYNDLVLIKNCSFDDIKEGDFIAFNASLINGDKIVITHEVVEIKINSKGQKFAITKGINLKANDVIPVTENGINGTNEFVGKYVFKSKFLGNAGAFLKSKYGLTSVSINLACILGIYFVMALSNSKKEENNGKN